MAMDKIGLWIKVVAIIAAIGMVVVADTVNVY